MTKKKEDEAKKKTQKKEHSQEEMQKAYMQYQLVKQQLSSFAEERGKIVEKLKELMGTIESLKKLEGVDNGSEMWTPMGSGAFVSSDVKDVDDVLVAVGAGIVTKEKREKAIEILQARFQEMDKVDDMIIEELKRLSAQSEKLEKELKDMVGEE